MTSVKLALAEAYYAKLCIMQYYGNISRPLNYKIIMIKKILLKENTMEQGIYSAISIINRIERKY